MSAYVEPKTATEIETLEAARARIIELEAILAHFATIGMLMSNAAFNLASVGRAKEPAGGYWINGLDKSMMKANDQIFYVATNVYGRDRVERQYCEAMERLRVQAEADAELLKMTTPSDTPS